MANGANLAAIINAAGSLLGGLVPSFTHHANASTVIEGFLTQISAELSDPDAVKQAAGGILSTPNVPIEVAMIARQIQQQANNPNVVLGLVARASAVLSQQNSSIFSHITSYTAPTASSPGTIILG